MCADGSGGTASAPACRLEPAGSYSSAAAREVASGCPRSARVGSVQRRNRLSRSRDFDAVYRHGRSVSTRFLVLYWFTREDGADAADEGPRLGLAVPKAVGTAVVRNRIKRRLRELFRERSGDLPRDHDYVLVV